MSGHVIVMDDLTISTSGTTVIPLPATLPLLLGALAASGIVLRRRGT